MQPITFTAPWSRRLRLGSSIATVALLIAAAVATIVVPASQLLPYILLSSVFVLIPLTALVCMIRGYTVTDTEIHIRRAAWTVRLPLRNLQAVEGNAEAMLGAWRLFGNYGLFSFTGRYWSKRLGFFRAYATDPDRAVVLRYPNKTIVITPHDPQQFIMRVRTLLSTADFPL